MKVTFDKSTLLSHLAPCMGCISTKSTFTSIEGVLIRAEENGKCVICTYDTEKGMHAEMDADVEEAGSYIVGAQDFFQYVKIMPQSTVTLEVNEKLVAKVSSGRVYYMMHALNGKEFPAFPELFEVKGYEMEQKVFKNLIFHTFHSIATVDNNHQELCGGFLKISRDTVSMVSCNSFTLSKCDIRYDLGAVTDENDISMIIPGKSLAELNKLLSDADDATLIVRPARRHIVFDIDGRIFFTRLIDAKYVDYERIIQNNLTIEAVVDRMEMIDSLERASLISEKKNSGSGRGFVKLDFGGRYLRISSDSITAHVFDEIECDHTGDDIQIGFNCRYLLDCLRAIDSERVRMYLKAPRICMVIRPEEENDDKTILQMILPVKMEER